jgi:predicted RNA methylase
MTTGLQRNTIDKYYTKPEIAKKCIDLVQENYYIENFDNIIEPSAGNGSFSNQIPNCKAYDLVPEHKSIKKQDFLKLKNPKGTTLIIGNPPFGRQSSTAKSFITKSCSFANVIAFILPKSFKKISFQKTFPLEWHLTYELNLPNNSFTVDNNEHDVPCIFQIWEKKEEERVVKSHGKPDWLEYTTADDADFSFRRVGVYAGKVSKDTSLSKQSHYFIKVTDDTKDVDDMIDMFESIEWEFDNSVGPKSISKHELHEKLNELI